MPIRTPDGRPLLFETYQRRGAVEATGRRIWLPFGPLLLGEPRPPLARPGPARVAARAAACAATQGEREALLVRAVEASADERRRIAADLHDGASRTSPGSRTRSAPLPGAEASPPATATRCARTQRPATRDSDAAPPRAAPRDPPTEPAGERARAGPRRPGSRGSKRGGSRPSSRSRSRTSARLTADDERARLPGGARGPAERRAPRRRRGSRRAPAGTEDGAPASSSRDDGAGFSPEERERRAGRRATWGSRCSRSSPRGWAAASR